MTADLRLFYGGSFNPVHIGHARLALEVVCRTEPVSFAFTPCKAWGDKSGVAVSDTHRLAMLRLLIEALNGSVRETAQSVFSMDTLDLDRDGHSFTVDSLAMLRQKYPSDRLAWVMGWDRWATLDHWHHWQNLVDHAGLLVVNRPGEDTEPSSAQQRWAESKTVALDQVGTTGSIAFVQTTPLNISSSMIRHSLSNGDPASFLLPDAVLQYISEHQLYTSKGL